MKNMKNIKITEFSLRHFDPKFGGTKVLMDTEDFEYAVNSTEPIKILDGYADFCKILVFENTNTVRCGSMAITLENAQYIRSGYSSRTEKELAVLSR